jgi:hypothetical protein
MDITKATLLTSEVYGADEGCSDTWPVTLKSTGAISSSTDWSNQPAAVSTIQTMNPKSAWCGTQDVNFDVTSAMQAAKNSTKQFTFGLYGDESNLPSSACSPSSSYNCGFMRFSDNPTISVVYDLAPSAPAQLSTTPMPVLNGSTSTSSGCGTSAVGWIGKTDVGASNGSQVTLNAQVASNMTGESVKAESTLWDDMTGAHIISSPASAYVASGTVVHLPVGVALQDGHEYGWEVVADDGTLASQPSAICHFYVDLTAPTQPVVTSATFPAAGSESGSPPVTGTTGTFSFSSTDPVPAGTCTSAACVASGVAGYEYSFNKPLAATGSATVAPGTPVSFTPQQWGTNILYVAAVDGAGNVSQPVAYPFYVSWNPAAKITAGDIDGDGIPDLLATSSSGSLLLYRGGADPAIAPQTAGTPATSPDGTSWSTFQITHRGSMSQGSVDDLFVHKGANLWLYQNNPANPGAAPQFRDTSSLSGITPKPSCAATASDAGNCAQYDAADWSDVSQILAPGDAYGSVPSDNGLPSLLTVENDQLWLYQGEFGGQLGSPVLLGSSGWSGMTLIAPGEVGGQLTVWARDNSTGTLYSWPLTLDSNGVPELGTAAVGEPVAATSGSVVSGLSLPSASYPFVVSSGALTGGSCGTVATACAGLYAEDTAGNLWYIPGEPVTGGASPLSGISAAILVGSLGGAPGSTPGCTNGPPCPGLAGTRITPLF